MKLTREQWQNLEKMPIKKRVERLEERISDLDNRVLDFRKREFEKEFDKINYESDTKCIWAICIAMILLWVFVWTLICKFAL